MPSNRYFSAAIAFLLWGGWAFFVNRETSNYDGLIAALSQGCASFIITLLMVHSIRLLRKLFNKSLTKLFLPAIITVCFTGSCLFVVHKLASTANIFTTILPALSVAFVFCVFTSYQLSHLNKQEQ